MEKFLKAGAFLQMKVNKKQYGRDSRNWNGKDEAPLKRQFVLQVQRQDPFRAETHYAGGYQGIGNDVDPFSFGVLYDLDQSEKDYIKASNERNAKVHSPIGVFAEPVEEQQ